MNRVPKFKLFLVDDDVLFLRSLEIQFQQDNYFVTETFTSGEHCLEQLSKGPDLIILDYQLDGVDKNAMNGIETMDKIHEFNPDIPVVILSAQDKIEVAIDCMHHKSLDYVVKSETSFMRLQKIINNIIKSKKIEKELNWYMDRM